MLGVDGEFSLLKKEALRGSDTRQCGSIQMVITFDLFGTLLK